MDVDSLEAMLVSFDTIPDVVFNYLQDADPAGDQTLTLVVRFLPLPQHACVAKRCSSFHGSVGFQVLCSALALSWASVLESQR